jgi:hypothetical protein
MKQETAAERQWKQNEHRDQDLARVKMSRRKTDTLAVKITGLAV